MTGKIYLRKNQTNLYGTLNMNDRDSALDKIMRFMDEEEGDDILNPLDHFTEEQIDKRIDKLDSIQAALEHEINGETLEEVAGSMFNIQKAAKLIAGEQREELVNT